ncbi:hypothetical protein R5M92_06735 [Halomonas sp. Bachu 37]|uniref:hypothetical protein n=1 Tax=Halomonas kashgarensis TaxID=3084920 RepID=UPI0032180F69
MSPPPVLPAATSRRHRRYGVARWWLAGLLVSCLLPASLSQTDALRSTERAVAVCLMVPAVLRARCGWLKRRRVSLRPIRHIRFTLQRLSGLSRLLHVLLRVPAAHDVLTRRGPPASA